MTTQGPGGFVADLTARFSGASARELARLSGWGRTTVTDIIKGRKTPSPEQLEDLLTAARVDAVERKQWMERLAAERATAPFTESPAIPDPPRDGRPPADPPTQRWGMSSRVSAGIMAAAVAAVSLIAWYSFHPPVRDVSGQVRCQSGASVVGVWLVGDRGDGSWARVRPGTGSAVVFNGQARGDTYRVFAGCSGTPQQWGAEARSGYLGASDVKLLCDDRPAAVSIAPYIGPCVVEQESASLTRP